MNHFELDHLFVATAPEAPGIEEILALGLCEGTRNVHPGQGTANRRIFFHNAMIEFLWVTDVAQASSHAIRRTRLAERCDPTRQDVCPFGICLRTKDGAEHPPPFTYWDYRPPYLPPGMAIPMATNSDELTEPLIFAIPFGGRPDHYPADRRQPIDHPLALREVTKVGLVLPASMVYSSAVRYLLENGLVEIVPGTCYQLLLEFDQAAQGESASLAPLLPLTLIW